VCAGEIGAERQVRERICVVVENGADFVHVGDAVVILGTESEAREGGEFGDADCVKVPSSENVEICERHDVACQAGRRYIRPSL